MNVTTNEYFDGNRQFSIGFSGVFDYVHLDQMVDIFRINILPNSVEKRLLYAGWHSSHIEYHIQKDNIGFIVALDEYDIISLTLKSENTPKSIELVRKWVYEVRKSLAKLK